MEAKDDARMDAGCRNLPSPLPGSRVVHTPSAEKAVVTRWWNVAIATGWLQATTCVLCTVLRRNLISSLQAVHEMGPFIIIFQKKENGGPERVVN